MKFTRLSSLLTGALAALAFSASASAAPIDASLLFGTSTPGSPAQEGYELNRLVSLVGSYNASQFAPYSFNAEPNPPPNAITTLDVAVNSKVWGDLVAPDNVFKPNAQGFDFAADVDLTGVDFILGKYGNDSFYFYVGGLSGFYSLPTTFGGNGLSHWTIFRGEDTPGVPDQTGTLLLLVSGLGTLLVWRNRKA